MSGYRIMIVEDDLSIQTQLKILLSGNGYTVRAVTDFSETVRQVKAFAPHLILLDIALPGNSGFEICSQIRSFRREGNRRFPFLSDQRFCCRGAGLTRSALLSFL